MRIRGGASKIDSGIGDDFFFRWSIWYTKVSMRGKFFWFLFIITIKKMRYLFLILYVNYQYIYIRTFSEYSLNDKLTNNVTSAFKIAIKVSIYISFAAIIWFSSMTRFFLASPLTEQRYDRIHLSSWEKRGANNRKFRISRSKDEGRRCE